MPADASEIRSGEKARQVVHAAAYGVACALALAVGYVAWWRVLGLGTPRQELLTGASVLFFKVMSTAAALSSVASGRTHRLGRNFGYSAAAGLADGWLSVAPFALGAEWVPLPRKAKVILVGVGMLWLTFGCTLAVVLGWLLPRVREVRPGRGRCTACGYDVRGRPGPCPECGAAVEGVVVPREGPAAAVDAEAEDAGVIVEAGQLSWPVPKPARRAEILRRVASPGWWFALAVLYAFAFVSVAAVVWVLQWLKPSGWGDGSPARMAFICADVVALLSVGMFVFQYLLPPATVATLGRGGLVISHGTEVNGFGYDRMQWARVAPSRRAPGWWALSVGGGADKEEWSQQVEIAAELPIEVVLQFLRARGVCAEVVDERERYVGKTLEGGRPRAGQGEPA